MITLELAPASNTNTDVGVPARASTTPLMPLVRGLFEKWQQVT